MKLILIVSAFILSFQMKAHAHQFDDLFKLCPADQITSNVLLARCSEVTLNSVRLDFHQMKLVDKLTEKAADSWADSVLEGDVDTLFMDKKISAIQEVLTKDGRLLGYAIEFSFAGWEISCIGDDYDPNDPSTYATCRKGRIVEEVLANPELSYIVDLQSPELLLGPSLIQKSTL